MKWIMIETVPPVAGFAVAPLSIFAAKKEHSIMSNEYHANLQFTQAKGEKLWYRSIMTEQGKLVVAPHEYSVVNDQKLTDYFEAVKRKEAYLIWLSGKKQKGFTEAIFYVMQRGISITEAIPMVLGGKVKSQYLFYLEMAPAVRSYFLPKEESYYKAKVKQLPPSRLSKWVEARKGFLPITIKND